MPDAFIAAAAYFENSIVISDDADFKRIQEIGGNTIKEIPMQVEAK
jgi:predicted nucleic acid-binding protein